MLDERRHAACVDGWLKRSAAGLSTEALLRLFDAALSALWKRARLTLGEITLCAIAERVLHHATERFPLFSALKVDPIYGIDCHGLNDSPTGAQTPELIQGICFVLTEFLTVIGHLTAEILTPELHSQLTIITQPAAATVRKDRRS